MIRERGTDCRKVKGLLRVRRAVNIGIISVPLQVLTLPPINLAVGET